MCDYCPFCPSYILNVFTGPIGSTRKIVNCSGNWFGYGLITGNKEIIKISVKWLFNWKLVNGIQHGNHVSKSTRSTFHVTLHHRNVEAPKWYASRRIYIEVIGGSTTLLEHYHTFSSILNRRSLLYEDITKIKSTRLIDMIFVQQTSKGQVTKFSH